MTKSKLYALLVGINNYQTGITRLHGCRNDVHKFSSYLESQTDCFEVVDNHSLLDQEATKSNIIKQFRAHLGQVQAGDTALFYFSGHGCREDADPVLWPRENDRLLEGLVCYHPEPNNEGDVRNRVNPEVLLVDKELRYLIWELSQKHPKGAEPHIVVIIDCCHSGDVTRNVLAQGDTMQSRREELIAKRRALKEFIFPAEWLKLKQEQARLGGVDYLEGQHIHLAACQPHQLAKEDYLDKVGIGNPAEKTGIFTHYLLQFLQQNGNNLSYYDIHTRLKIYTRFRFEQVPQVYVPLQNRGWLYRGFLNRPLLTTPVNIGQIHYDDKKGWVLNLGALHNISGRSIICIQIGDTTVEGKPIEVQPDLSVLQFIAEDTAKLDRDRSYPCKLEGLLSEPLNVCVQAEPVRQSLVKDLKTKLQAHVRGLNFIDTPSEGSYTLHLLRGEYRLAQPEAYRPIVQPIKMDQKDAIDVLGRYLRQVSQWEYVKGLQSEAAEQGAFPIGLPLDIRIEIQQKGGRFVDWPKKNEELVVLPLREMGAHRWGNEVKIYLKNRYNRPLWVAALYLDTNYSATSILDQKVQMLGAYGNMLLWDSGIKISLKPHFYDYNWTNDLSRIKFIVSTKANIEIEQLIIEEGLPLPISTDSEQTKDGTYRGLTLEKETEVQAKDGWITQELALQIPNPLYNSIARIKLEKLLNHPVLREYAEEIYLTSMGTLKEGIYWSDASESNVKQ